MADTPTAASTPPDPSYRQITDDQFDAEFQPERNPDGSLYRQRDWTDPDDLPLIEQAARAGKCWTALDCDGKWVLSSGKHWVNRLYYVITEVAVPAGAHIEVVDADDTEADARAPVEG
jgi:hypothetical protein